MIPEPWTACGRTFVDWIALTLKTGYFNSKRDVGMFLFLFFIIRKISPECRAFVEIWKKSEIIFKIS